MKQLRVRTLSGVFAVALVISWAGAKMLDGFSSLPGVPLAASIVLALIAAALTATALTFRVRFREQRERRPEAKGVDPLLAARAVVFGQASALVASLVGGVYGGTGLYLLMYVMDIPPRRDQAVYAALAVAAAVAVVAAALWLQRICRLPDDEEPLGAL